MTRWVLFGVAAFAAGWTVRAAGANLHEAVLHALINSYREGATQEHQSCAETIGRLSVALRAEQTANVELARSLAAHQDHIEHLEHRLAEHETADLDAELRRLSERPEP